MCKPPCSKVSCIQVSRLVINADYTRRSVKSDGITAGPHFGSSVCANLAELPVRQRLREDAGVDQAERVPLGRTFGLEVPEDPVVGMLAKHSKRSVCEFAATYQPLVLRSKASSCASMKPRTSSLNV